MSCNCCILSIVLFTAFSLWAKGYNPNAAKKGGYVLNDKSFCFAENAISLSNNQGVPYNLDDVRLHYKGIYREMPEKQSILHNFKKGLEGKLSTPESRLNAAIQAFVDYNFRARENWVSLDPELPNVKFVEINGHKEIVFNKKTGSPVETGINQGTYNEAINQTSDVHVFVDIPKWIICGTPDQVHRDVVEILSKDRKLFDELLKIREDAVIGFLKSLGLSDQESKTMLSSFKEQFEKIKSNEEKEVVTDTFCTPYVDTTKFEKLINGHVAYLKSLIAKGERFSEEEVSVLRTQMVDVLNEYGAIGRQILALQVSDEKKKEINDEIAKKLTPHFKEWIAAEESAVSEKLVGRGPMDKNMLRRLGIDPDGVNKK